MNARPSFTWSKQKMLGCLLVFILFNPISLFLYYTLLKKDTPRTAFDECEIEMKRTGIELDCDDDDADWYKMKKIKKNAIIAQSSPIKSGFGTTGSSSTGG